MTSSTPVLPDPSIRLANIQGNSIAGFSKDFQHFIFFEIADADSARPWVAVLAGEVASAAEVGAFNSAFKSIVARRNLEPGAPTGLEATWVNLAFSFEGLLKLGISAADQAQFPGDFRDGMRARADRIGDTGPNAPDQWTSDLGDAAIGGVLILASDDEDDLAEEVARQSARMREMGLNIIFEQPAHIRADEPGHEHFGFKDGISQPGLRGLTPSIGTDPDQGDPGQDLLNLGEFVLGYPANKPAPPPPPPPPAVTATPFDPAPGAISRNGPEWAADGSYLVLRRLAQNVKSFRDFVEDHAGNPFSEEVLGAKIVGRYRSGCPIEPMRSLPGVLTTAGDPAVAMPAVLDPLHVNDFEYGDDADGAILPRAGHIRKAYPRNEPTPKGGEADTQKHRILRRGIPYGASFSPDAGDGDPGSAAAERGLMFLCYQASIARQFEVVQHVWVNGPDFPQAGDGIDLLIAPGVDGQPRESSLPGGDPPRLTTMERWVTLTFGEYFFQPSISALEELARLT